MPFSFSTALSGLRASSNALGVTGNNIANANTTAFKTNSAHFADVYTNSLGVRLNGAGQPLQVGSGVTTSVTTTDFSQGALTDASSTSAAIQGNGFFVVRDNSGAQNYTRAGDFTLDREGYLVTPTGMKVQGFTATDGAVAPGSPLTAIKLPIGETLAPVATSKASVRMNLNSTDAASSEFHAPVRVYDSKGVSRNLDMAFTKQSDGSYVMNATLDGNAAQVNGGATLAFTFDASGQLTSPQSLTIAPDQTMLDGATLPSIAVALRATNPDGTPGAANITNYSSASSVSATDQDGFAAGSLTGFAISTDHLGAITATFSNGQSRLIGQLALANFNSQDGLRHLGGNLYSETLASGQPSVGAPGSGGRGEIAGGALEQSNVDIASELTDLIVAQRSYQANSRVITSINQTLQDLLQIV